MTDTDYDFDDGECPNCGGEGRVAGTCIDGCCLEQDDPDCPYCSHVCDCQRKPSEDVQRLRQILGDALAAAPLQRKEQT